jgi:hypothetical protein
MIFKDKEYLMKKILKSIISSIFLIVMLVGCSSKEVIIPEQALSPEELLQNPVYDVEVQVVGEVNALGELFCSCFSLKGDAAQLDVWYDTMLDEDGVAWPAVSIDGIKNGDRVIVTGVLRPAGGANPPRDFWATAIEKLD